MEPQIRYVQSADGTRIATSSLGEGRPLVYHPIWFNTIELLWRIPKALANLERLAQKRKVVLYDSRGTGLSSRDAVDFSLDARVADLEAVVASHDVDHVDLLSGGRPAAVAIAFAARRPEKVSKLALGSTMARGADYRVTDERLLLLEPLAAVDWEFYIQCRALVLFGWNDVGRLLAELQAGEVSREVHSEAHEGRKRRRPHRNSTAGALPDSGDDPAR